jgi:hypothetical protein
MMSSSPLHGQVCAACAVVCDACAESCEQVGDMDECVQACRACAQSCYRMGEGQADVNIPHAKTGMPSDLQDRLPM